MTEQLDYIYFFHGLGFILLAVVCFALGRRNQHSLPWVWIGLFGLVRGLNEWLNMLALVLGDSISFKVIRVCVMTMSFLCLVEFGRLGTKSITGKGPGRWITLVLFSIGCTGWYFGRVGSDVLVRYSLCFVGGTWSAFALIMASRCLGKFAERRLLFVLAGLFTFYAVASCLIVPSAPFLPASLLNQDVFLQQLGFTVQLLRGLLAVAIAICVWQLLQPRRNRLHAYIFIVSALVILVCGWLFVNKTGEAAGREKLDCLRSVCSILASSIDPKVAEELGKIKDVNDPRDYLLRKRFRMVLQTNPEYRRIYLMSKRGKQIIFTADSEPTTSKDYIPHGTVYSDAPVSLREVFDGKRQSAVDRCEDKWGQWATAFIPIRNKSTGKIAAVLGIDRPHKEIQGVILSERVDPTVITLLVMVLLVAFYAAYERQRDSIERILASEEALQTEKDNLSAIFASSPVGMLLIDEETMIVDANSILASMVSKNLGEIINQHGGAGLGCVHSFETEMGCGYAKACSECLLRQGVTQVLKAGTSIHGAEIQTTLLIGEIECHLWLRISAKPVSINSRRHVIVAIDNISDRKLAEETLLDREHRYRSLWESASEGFCLHELVMGADGAVVNYRILDVNTTYESITGLKAVEVIGKLATEAYKIDYPPYLDIYARVVVTGVAETFETLFGPMGRHFCISVFSPSPGQFATAFSDISERKAHEDMLSYQSTHDALTNLPNRLYFEQYLNKLATGNAKSKSGSIAVLFLDLDNFKMVNDTMGHKVGDTLLIETAARLDQCMREGDTLARMGGDEFTVLMTNISSKDDAAMIAQRILEKISIPFQIDGSKLVIGVSIGVSIYPENAADADELLKSADAAMYKAKELGRNNYQFFSDELIQANIARVEMERDLRHAIERDDLKVYYQPIVDVRAMQVAGAEALLRWNHPEKGIISPGLFIPVAEETGLILKMGKMVLEAACMQCENWHNMGYPDFEISVNVSPVQLGDIGFVSDVKRVLLETGLPPRSLKLEITETVIAKSNSDALNTLCDLKSLGVSICLDDFGIGYSSLSRLNNLPIDHLKIDGYFIRNIEQSQKNKAMTESIIVMSHNLDIQVTAEWIEDEEQMATIRSLDCDYAQGYLISPALSSNAFEDFIREWMLAHKLADAA